MSQCPVCNKPTVKDFNPFCSRHCKNIDLLKWMNGGYRIPVQNLDEEEGLPTSTQEEDKKD